jgi:hypothetical protein
MALPLMPKATAVWLVENTSLTFEQIADFCGMHSLEIQGIADGEVAVGIIGQDPVTSGQLTKEDIEAAEQDPNKELKLNPKARQHLQTRVGTKYTPRARRHDKPEAISWILKHHPYISDTRIMKLIGTTKKTIESIRDKSHWNINNITPKDPVLLGLCSQTHLDEEIRRGKEQNPQLVPQQVVNE